jgi:hypothetical protein
MDCVSRYGVLGTIAIGSLYSDGRSTLQVETLELLPNIMEGAVRECLLLPSFLLSPRLTYLRMFCSPTRER